MAAKLVSPDVVSMSVSIEQERDSLQEKVDHLKILLKQYQQELQSQKIRKEGVETVSKLLQESRQENNLLQKKNKTLETVIRNLQSRLSGHGLSDSITLEEGDVFIPGTSKQLLDNLARENARLRTLVKSASVDPEEMNKLHQVIEEYAEKLAEYKQRETAYEARVAELEHLLNSSDSQKDVEISRLRNTIQSMQSESQTRDVLCHSLTEETHNLRSQLRDVAARCQEMAVRLDQGERISDGAKSNTEQMTQSGSEEIDRLREECMIYKSKAEEVTKMNKRWQEYNTQREKYVQYLQSVNQELESNLHASQASQVTPQRSQEINAALEEAKRRLQRLEHEKRQLETELQERNQHLIHQTEEIERLQAQIANSRSQGGSHHSDTETIEALKAQIQICTEDFESERKDREKAQSRVAALEAELKQLKDRERYQPKVDVYQNRHAASNPEFYNDFNLPANTTGGYQFEPQLAARGNLNRYNVADSQNQLQTDSEPASSKSSDLVQGKTPVGQIKEQDTKEVTDPSPSLPALSLTAPSLNDLDDEIEETCDTSKSSSTKNKHTLNCPRCGQEFEADKHGDLLEHIEMCCD